MNQLTTTRSAGDVEPFDPNIRGVLGSSLYPGAKPASIDMVLDYCRAAKLNPLLKAVHIVPMSVRLPNGNYEYRDVIMPGIAHYRIQADRTGFYLGKTEPEFGPEQTRKWGSTECTFPAWCKVTVKRRVGQHVAEFTAVEFWLENFATAGRDKPYPNAMWSKRPFGQLHKCAEAQALRMAFPELLGGTNSAEEMEGKVIDAAELRDVTPAPAETKAETAKKRSRAAKAQLDGFAGKETPAEDADSSGDAAAIPEMPKATKTKLDAGKWGAAFTWISKTIGTLPAERRQEFAEAWAGVIILARDHNEEGAATVKQLCDDHGVTIDAS